MATPGTIETKKQFKNTPVGLQQRWGIEISAAKEARKQWLKQGENANKRYLDEHSDSAGPRSRLNLFHSNINIVLAILFSQVPKTDVSRRFADSDDEEARVSSEILERILNTDIEDENDDFETECKDALQDWKITGLGQCRLQYSCETEQVPEEPARVSPEGVELAPAVPPYDKKAEESIETCYVHWKDFLWSPCRRWKDNRWVAFKAEMSRDDAVKRFGKDIGGKIPLEKRSMKDGENPEDFKEAWSRAIVWEIWSKDDKTVYWYAEGFDRILDSKPDPLELSNFFPCPRPLMANVTTSKMMPKPDLELERNLYDEVDELTQRIRNLERMAKVCGAYDKSNPELGRILEETLEGQMIGVAGWGKFMEKGGMAGSMQFVPLDMIVKAIEVLTTKRVEKIQLLDQLVGLSAAIRGQSDPNSTATANRIEAGFASTRLETDKDEVARFASDLQKIRAEIISTHYEPQTIIEKSNALRTEIDPGTKQPNVNLILKAVTLIKSQFWQYRIQVKADSIAMRDYASMKQERVETVSALAGLFQQAIPMVQLFPQAAPFLLQVGKWLIASTKGSQQIEGQFDKFADQVEQAAMQPKPPPPPDPKLIAAQVKAKAEIGKAQATVQQTQLDGQVHVVKAAMDMKVADQQHGMDMQKMAAQAEVDAQRSAQQLLQNKDGPKT